MTFKCYLSNKTNTKIHNGRSEQKLKCFFSLDISNCYFLCTTANRTITPKLPHFGAFKKIINLILAASEVVRATGCADFVCFFKIKNDEMKSGKTVFIYLLLLGMFSILIIASDTPHTSFHDNNGVSCLWVLCVYFNETHHFVERVIKSTALRAACGCDFSDIFLIRRLSVLVLEYEYTLYVYIR